MGDPRNWTARKVDSVRRENAAADRERLVEVTLYHHGAAELADQRGPNFLALHPCDTFRVLRFRVTATCAGCGLAWEVSPYEMLQDCAYAHRPWPVVMARVLICPRCTSCPRELRFKNDRGGDVGAVSVDSVVTLHVSGVSGITKPVISHGMPDADAQHDDGAA